MGSIVGTPNLGNAGSGGSSVVIPINSTTAGNDLVVFVIGLGSRHITSITASGATFTERNNLNGSAWWSLYTASGISSGITSITAHYSGYQSVSYCVVEVSGVDYDVSSIKQNGYNVSSLGTGSSSITTTGGGIALAIFQDGYESASGCSAGSGWTGGSWNSAGRVYYEYRTTVASQSIGGSSGQATASGSGYDFGGCVVNMKDTGGGGGGGGFLNRNYWWDNY